MVIELCRLTKDMELKTVTINGEDKKVLNNMIAIKIDKENTTFIEITVWQNLAEKMAEFFKKGDELLIKGELRSKIRKVENKDINIPYILVQKFEFTHGNKKEVEE